MSDSESVNMPVSFSVFSRFFYLTMHLFKYHFISFHFSIHCLFHSTLIISSLHFPLPGHLHLSPPWFLPLILSIILLDIHTAPPANLCNISQLRQPAVLYAAEQFHPANTVPDTGEPVSEQDEHQNQQHQHGCAVLQVVVKLSNHPAKAQKSDYLQSAEQSAYPLRINHEEIWEEIRS